ncbi:response regulator [Polaribacter vadi]|uniref:chemotaxis protein CheB n=1 Tax=Polaribacter TaxID=52959 RepID=UPI001C0A1645|nr:MULTISPECIES: chemotaxis protein CheB [Polaribacter]MBU3011259.1 response regulator [Polaribacter vadi]MDO6741072.1 chemotaxis protein CheB [Polaribacter sp. 1_MG-2023]
MKKPELYVVAIGASAGGLDAIQQVFDNIPEDTGMAFVVIQHLSPDFISLMPELLAKHTKMKIFTAEDKLTIQPNCIYLNQRNKNLHIKGRELYLLDKGPKHNLNLPIDIFFHTLGEEYHEKSIGVILSGTGSDGSRGIKTIKENGGVIFVQDPITAQFDGMPNSSIATDLVDFILNPKDIAKRFNSLLNPPLIIDSEFPIQESNEVLINKILQEVHKYSDIDFREYKKNTLLRRLEKRMNINNIDELYNYLTFLKNNEKEKESLKQDFLIGVTRFFRDTEAFQTLQEEVIPSICAGKKNSETIRVWVPGCSSGEEVYSIAMLLDSHIRSYKLNINFKIFASDIDPRAITAASAGTFHVNVINELDTIYLDKYFTKIGDKLQIIKRIREKIVFSSHNLIKSPPFIRMDLISCRNLLIYLDSKVQRKVMYNFQFALNKFGYLFLGNSESLGEVSKFYKTIDTKWKIYQNISDTKHIPIQNSPSGRVPSILYNNPPQQASNPLVYRFKENPENVFHKYLSKKYSPSSIFFDKDYNIIYIKGDAGIRLNHTEGLFENNLLKVVDDDLSTIIRSAVNRLAEEKKDVIVKDVLSKTKNGNFSFDLYLHKPTEDDLNDIYLLQFGEDKETDDQVIIENIPIDKISKQRIDEIEDELKSTKTELQNVVEELETSNEELQSSNEELMASNEELQSTNEELQSVNEELYTVNAELQEKNKQLTNLNNDVTNLLDNTDIGTLFLDRELYIRKYTPAIQKHFNLKETDIGRLISSFASNFNEKIRLSILNNSKKVLEKLTPIEKEIVDKDGNFYLSRISPFITIDKKIDGIIITFVEITKLKETEIELANTELRYQNLFQNLNEGFSHAKIITDRNDKPIDWEYISINTSFEKQINLSEKEIIGKPFSKINPDIKNDSINWLEVYGYTAQTGIEQKLESYSTKLDKYYIVRVFSPKKGEFAATFADVTDLKKKEEQLSNNEKELKRIQNLTHVGSWYLDLKTGKVTWTEELYKTFRLNPNLPPPSFSEQERLFSKKSWVELNFALNETQKTGIPYEVILEVIHENKIKGWLWARGETVKDAHGETIGLRGASQDITEYKSIEKQLLIARQKAEFANIHKNYFLANMSHEIRTPISGVIGFSELLRDENISAQEKMQYLDIIDGNSKQLLSLIDDIIDIAKIEANELKISPKNCNITELVKNIEINFNQIKTAKKKTHITTKSYIPKEAKNLTVLTDPLRLRQVITNLLNNSLKFSEKGEISFGFEIKNEVLEFFVKDEGIGIPKDKLDEIFDRFKQINYSDNAKYGGTGLGLSICKGIISNLGGKITVASTLNKGATFKFTIPIKIIEKDSLPKRKENKILTEDNYSFLKDKTILVAEDDEIVKLMYTKFLKGTKAKTIFAPNGKLAVEQYIKNKNIDIVLMDIRMPEMNGFDATKKILELNPNAIIIMQSAYAMHDEKEKCFEIGCKDYLTKPVIKKELFRVLHKWID